jgi:hypothetical protein
MLTAWLKKLGKVKSETIKIQPLLQNLIAIIADLARRPQ